MKVVYELSNGAIFNDLEWPLSQISRARHWILQKVRNNTRWLLQITNRVNIRPIELCHCQWSWVTFQSRFKYYKRFRCLYIKIQYIQCTKSVTLYSGRTS